MSTHENTRPVIKKDATAVAQATGTTVLYLLDLLVDQMRELVPALVYAADHRNDSNDSFTVGEYSHVIRQIAITRSLLDNVPAIIGSSRVADLLKDAPRASD